MNKIYGLIGFPIGHSFSAQYFTDKFELEKINAQYLNFPMEDISKINEVLAKNNNIAGFNVTIPHKQNVLPYLNDIDIEAKEIGAINVIKATRIKNGYSLKGYNSDAIGFEKSLLKELKPNHKKALIFGTGGASKAIVYTLKKLGISYKFVSRNPHPDQFSYNDITPEIIHEYTLLINCTPLGMSPKTDLCPDIPYKHISTDHYLYDLIYNPETTLFLEKGLERGATIKNGLEMLHLQAEASWKIWNQPEE